ncbi:nucleoside hydrolase [Corynebacterium kroppenstedtii]|uniref:nucleoside hydrolase n=1 Tax=Corynebacterium sp. PCR 32 TaxID=3351342 RepID=UPI0030B1294D
MRRLVADVDTGIDDMLAVIYLAARHRAGDIDVAGITTTAGNTTAENAAVNTRWVLDLCGCPDIPVGVGPAAPVRLPLTTTPETHGPCGLGYACPPDAIRDEVMAPQQGRTAEQAPSPVTARRVSTTTEVWEAALEDGPADLVVTGPLTSAAMNPGLVSRYESLTVMGGAINYPGNTTPTAEWNFWVDPDAVAMVLENIQRHAWDTTLCHLGVTETITVTPADIGQWGMGGQLKAVVRDALRFYFEFHDKEGIGYLAQVHDLLAIMVALDAVPYTTLDTTVATVPGDRGAVVPVSPLPADTVLPPDSTRATIHVLNSVDPNQVRAEMRRAVALL